MSFARISYVLALVSVAVACGGSDDGGLFGESGGTSGAGGGSGGSSGSGGTNGGASGSGGARATGGSTSVGGSGGAVGGSGGDGAQGGVGGVGAGPGQGGVGGDAGGSGASGVGGVGASGGAGGSPTKGWCPGHCGTGTPIAKDGGGTCFCDEQCLGANDCCPDYGPVCNPGAGVNEVQCGTATCKTGGDLCCQQFVTGGLNPMCVPQGSTCIGPDIFCDGPEDCPAQVCCSTQVTGNNNVNLECRAAIDCTGQTQRIVCGNDVSACQPGQACVPHPWVPQYNYCVTPN